MKEVWKDIQGYEGKYQVSNLGNVKSLNYNNTCKEHLLNQTLCRGYMCIHLSKNCIHKWFLVHRLVATAFINNTDNLPEVNHIDEDKTNNCVSNLEWCDRKYNNNYGTRISRSLKTLKLRNRETAERAVLQFTKDGKFVNEYKSISEAERSTGIYQSSIVSCCKVRRLTAGGYIWKYKNNE